MISRIAQKKVTQLAKHFPVTAILGPRQSGKTTLAKASFPGYNYASLETPDLRAYAAEDPVHFLSSFDGSCVILDEIQRVPSLFSYLQTIVDAEQKMGRFILTGSHNFLLLEQISQSLAGRVGILHLLPLGIQELHRSGKLAGSLYEVLFRGGYPAVYDRHIDPRDWYPNYIATYVERDVRLIKDVSNLSKFQTFLKLCAGRVGQVLNISSLANDCGLSPNTARSWLGVLEASFVIFLIQPYYKNFNKRVIKQPKLYFYDTGLLCSLLAIDTPEQLVQHFAKGSIFESFVISEYMKDRLNRGLTPHIYFWRDHRGLEIDVILEHAGKLTAVEIKAGHTPNLAYFANEKKFVDKVGTVVQQSVVVYAGDETRSYRPGTLLSWRDMFDVFNNLTV